jgi:hypothetical protein
MVVLGTLAQGKVKAFSSCLFQRIVEEKTKKQFVDVNLKALALGIRTVTDMV